MRQFVSEWAPPVRYRPSLSSSAKGAFSAGNSIRAQSFSVDDAAVVLPGGDALLDETSRHREIAAFAVAALAVILHEEAVRQGCPGSIAHVQQGLLVAVAVAVTGVVVEPVVIRAAAGEDRACEFAA